MPYSSKTTNDAKQAVEPLFISVARYAALMGISPATARRDALAGKIPHIRNGDRILIPANEPQRQAAEASDSFKKRQVWFDNEADL